MFALAPNSVRPFRLGDVSRLYLLQRALGRRLRSGTLASIAERRFDVLTERLEGKSLPPLMSGQDTGAERLTVTETNDRLSVVVRSGRWRLAADLSRERYSRYDVVANPAASADIAAEHPAVVAELCFQLRDWLGAHP